MGKVLEVKELSKQYSKVLAADKVSFSIDEGEIFALIGPNGAGKTTTIRMISTLLTPTAGDALVVVNGGLPVLIYRNRLHRATHHARTMLEDDGRIGTRLRAFATFDTFVFIHRSPVVHNGDGVFRANLLAAVYHASATGRSHIDSVDGALVAGAIDDLNHVGVFLVAAHRHLDPVLQNGAFLVDAAAGLRFRAGTEKLGDFHVSVLQATLVGTADNLLQDFIFN